MEEGPRPVCTFLIPVVRDSDRRLHPPLVWRLLQDALLRSFGALTGPEPVLYYRKPDAVPGAWRPEEGEEPVEDLSRKYNRGRTGGPRGRTSGPPPQGR